MIYDELGETIKHKKTSFFILFNTFPQKSRQVFPLFLILFLQRKSQKKRFGGRGVLKKTYTPAPLTFYLIYF